MSTQRRLQLAAAVTLAMLCWLALLLWPAGQLSVCGPDGIASIIPAWSVDRAISLMAMWMAMSAAMLLPCMALDILRAGAKSDHAIEAGLATALALAIAIAPVQWTLESLGAMSDGRLPGGVATQLSLVAIAAAAVTIHIVSRSRFASLVAMLALQFAGGPMNLGWMAAISAAMLALAAGRPALFAVRGAPLRHNDALIKSSILIQTE